MYDFHNLLELNFHAVSDFYVLFVLLLGVGIDAGNGKDWESNAKSIQLIKQRGKVKALDEEINSEH